MPTEKRQRKRENAQARRAAIEAAQRRAQTRRRAVTIVVVVLIVAGIVFAFSRGGDDAKDVATATTARGATTTVPASTTVAAVEPTCPPADGSAPRTMAFTKPFPTCIDPAKTYVATFETDAGTFVAELDPGEAPKTVNNFVSLARYHFYDGLTFHRVVQDFVIQGGDPTATGSGGPGYEFADELPKPDDYRAGSLAMANSGPDTNGSQFFVLVSDQAAKDLVQAVGGKASYSLFGQVTSGLDVVRTINADPGDPQNPPKVVHKIIKVTIEER